VATASAAVAVAARWNIARLLLAFFLILMKKVKTSLYLCGLKL
jgi:hypothetical protein